MAYAFVTKVKNIKEHSNADSLKLGECFGNQVVIDLDVEEEAMGVYFPTDTQLGKEYAEKNNLLRKKDENNINIGGYLDADKRNIRALKLRGEVSDGLFMSLESLSQFINIYSLKEGDNVDILNGIVIAQKYIPKHVQLVKTSNSSKNQKGKKLLDIISYPNFREHKDTKQFAYNMNAFKKGDLLTVSLKMHGTSGISMMAKQITRYKTTLLNKLLFKLKLKNETKEEYKLVSGSRRVILKNFTGGFYGDNNFRKKYHDDFDGKLLKGETVYYEIVGYTGKGDQTIMSKCSNSKTHDKEFIKKYGKETIFSYGCDVGENDIYVYRMTMTNEDGNVVEYSTSLIQQRCEQMNVKFVLVFKQFFFDNLLQLQSVIDEFVDGIDEIGKTHIKEGVVIRIENKQVFTAYKHKNTNFKILEGIIKDTGIVDIEEMEEDFI